MAIIKAFKGIRPVKSKSRLVASHPYDVLNKQEARIKVKDNKYSFLHVVKPEIDLPDSVDQYAPEVYQKGKENFNKLLDEKVLLKDNEEHLYIYAQTMNNRTQYGIVGCASVEDYINGIIKKHEVTLPAKVEERMNHIRVSGVNYEPVFFTYPAVKEIDEIVDQIVKEQRPEYDFTSDDGFGHHFWVIKNKDRINRIIELYSKVPYAYVADGHHRTASAALIGNERKKNNPNHKGNEEYNYFLAVHFPDNQLTIIDYNRVVKYLNGLSNEMFIEKLKENFDIKEKGKKFYKPDKLHDFSMYLNKKWYSMTAKAGTYDNNDPVGVLDVSILSNLVLDNLLGIKDLRRDERIDFVGGIRGLRELKARVDSNEMKVAFALYPVSMKQLINIADTGNIMPPKTTWFEPKLRSGLIIHSLD